MYSPSKWVGSVVQLVAIIVLIAGAAVWVGAKGVDRSVRQAAESKIAGQSPEATGSILKMIGR